MPPNNCDSAVTAADPAAADQACPKCGCAMESIENGAAGLPFENLELCPGCYLVIWRDRAGFQIRQGVPLARAEDPEGTDVAEKAVGIGLPDFQVRDKPC